MFDYAAQMAGLENKWQVEINEFCQKLLQVRYPDARRYKDIKKVTGTELGYVDVISGGFPCQPHSVAGKRKGSEDERNLFPEMLRVIREIKPEWVLGENVYGILNTDDGKFFEHEVITPLENEGYSVQPYIIPASAIGAVHRRDRLWIVAYNESRKSGKQTEQEGREDFSRRNKTVKNTRYRNDKRQENEKELTDEIGYEQTPELERSKNGNKEIHREGGCGFINSSNDASNTQEQGLERTITKRDTLTGRCDTEHFNANWTEVAAKLCRVDATPSTRLHESRYRKHRLEGLGNGIQWEIAYIFFQLMKEIGTLKQH
jgi:DNA (cytosine-5)-methyltransferase 1